MDNNTVIVIGIFALVIVVVALLYRSRIKASVKGPAGTHFSVDATNPPPAPGATVEDARSHGGRISADDLTGRGAAVRRADARGDITATSRKQEGGGDPKA